MPGLDTERVQQIIADSLEEFSKAYIKGYLKAVVQKIKDETEGGEPPAPMLLQTAPVPDYFKMGYLTKKGAINTKSWKKRWFCVDNEYRVAYYAGEKDYEINPKTNKSKKKPKGEFSCFGYRVKKISDDETGAKGDKNLTLKLKPYWDDDVAKRTYYFTAANKEEYDEWKKMLQEACYNSPNPMHKDPVRRAAFEDAYKALRGYSWFYASGSEGDMLAYIIFLRVRSEVLREFYTTLPDLGRSKIMDKTDSMVGGMIGPAVDAAWKAACVAVDNIEVPTEENVRKVVGPLFDALKKMKDAVQAKFDEKVVPVISKLMAPVAEKVIPKILEPIAKSQKELIEEFCKHKGERGSWNLYWDLRKRENEYDDVLGLAREILDEPELWNLPDKIMDSCFSMLEAATYTYNNVDNKDISVTAQRLYHDIEKAQWEILTWLVETIVLKPFNDAFGSVVDELVGPLEDMVPEDIKDFLSPSDMIKEMASNAMAAAIQACIGIDKPGVKLQQWFADNGAPIDESKVAAMAGTGTPTEAPASEEKTAYEARASVVPHEAVESDSDGEEKVPDAADKAAEAPAAEAPAADAPAADAPAADAPATDAPPADAAAPAPAADDAPAE